MPSRALLTRVAVGVVAAVAVGGAGALVLTSSSGTPSLHASGQAPQPERSPAAAASLPGSTGDVVPWDQPLSIRVDGGTVKSISVTGPDGAELPGAITPTGWSSATELFPRAQYVVHAVVVNGDGVTTTYDRTVQAAAPAQELKATLAPAGGGTYGIGQPVIVRFNHAVKSREARTAVQQRLSVTTTPAVPGAWRWFNSYEVHYRAEQYWAPHTTIDVAADLSGLRVPGTDIWGASGRRTSSMTIGDAFVATVDVTAHKMTVTRNGTVIRVVNVSHGCVNTSVSDARWFYENTHLGDIVNVIHAAVGPNRWDAGMADWNYSWTTWQQGNLGA